MKRHVSYCSWHEVGVYDLSANIDYILQHTNVSSLYYLGHSMGGTIFLVLMSEKPEYNNKIKLAQFFSPGAFAYYYGFAVVQALAELSNFFLVSK